jgi:hypothetical protein
MQEWKVGYKVVAVDLVKEKDGRRYHSATCAGSDFTYEIEKQVFVNGTSQGPMAVFSDVNKAKRWMNVQWLRYSIEHGWKLFQIRYVQSEHKSVWRRSAWLDQTQSIDDLPWGSVLADRVVLTANAIPIM